MKAKMQCPNGHISECELTTMNKVTCNLCKETYFIKHEFIPINSVLFSRSGFPEVVDQIHYSYVEDSQGNRRQNFEVWIEEDEQLP